MISRRAWLAGAAVPLLGCGSNRVEIQGGFAGAGPARGHLLRKPMQWLQSGALRRTQVVIAGGGVAGLAAARALRQRGIEDFALLELEDAAGGNSRAGSLQGLACPLGAHYLPVPGDTAREVQDLLEELGLRRRVTGRWVYDERHLCHSPQERLFFQGQWQEGLLPLQGVSPATLAQYQRFSGKVSQWQRTGAFAIPAFRATAANAARELDLLTFDAWLQREQLTDPHLRWYLDYCCRDDYGAGLATVSAWAGLHYFASRHGFGGPDEAPADREAVLTWPEGNGWLTARLAQPLGNRLRTGQVVLRVAPQRHEVEVDVLDTSTGTVERWLARHCVVALPVFIAARVVQHPPAFLLRAPSATMTAPWIVANLHLRAPLHDRPGAAPSWDNVVYGSGSLGYVDAGHQRLSPAPGPTVLTWYHAPGLHARREVLQRPWTHWRDLALAELAAAHPDLAGKLTRVEVVRYGHAMAVPIPGARAHVASGPPRTARLSFAHSDGAGYSIFEEAFTLGHQAGHEL